jgi:hypothetical protein
VEVGYLFLNDGVGVFRREVEVAEEAIGAVLVDIANRVRRVLAAVAFRRGGVLALCIVQRADFGKRYGSSLSYSTPLILAMGVSVVTTSARPAASTEAITSLAGL